MSRQRIRDPIHDLIVFPDDSEGRALWALLQSRPVQRLRRIKQLGFSEFVYPGASHKRLSHSLGAMQMARRMLSSFKTRDAIADFSPEAHGKWSLATLAAALVHDIGHGPYSHVFEELTEQQGAEIGHEEYTAQLIEETEISDILKDAGIYEETCYFFTKEKQSNPYSSIISSQLDCDRLDFLSRDRYFTGIRSSVIDLEWLFDSLSVEKVYTDEIGDTFEYSIVVNGKGLRVIEEFVNSYSKMYKDVYFHKTTRSMQHLATFCISTALSELTSKQIRGNRFLSVISQMDKNKPIDTETYISLDDSTFTNAIGYIENIGKGDSRYFASRYLNRRPLKCLDGAALGLDPAKNRRLRDELDAQKIWYYIDIIKEKGYKQYSVAHKNYTENIIINISGKQKRLHEVGHIDFADGHSVRFYFKDDDDREKALQIIAKS